MVGRRNVLSSSLLAGLTGALATSTTADAAPLATVERQSSPATVAASIGQIRQQQRTFIRANQKYPDYIEVGLSVWEDVYDWHVRYQQPINTTRLPDGRYILSFMFTNLILRPDQAFEFVGFGFDNDGRRTQ